MIDLRKLFANLPYIFEAHAWDTTNMRCHRGHVYSDGEYLVAALDNGTRTECRALRRLGQVVMDGDDGELSVKFRYTPETWQAVRKIMRPKQTAAILRLQRDPLE